MLPLVSVIIPTYKRECFLRETVNSVLNQTYSNIEIIVVDDDPESTIYRKNFLKNDRIRYFKNDRNKGASYCRNFGLKQAKGEYVAFLDDDDIWLSSKIEKQIKKFISLKNDVVGIVYSGHNLLVNKKVINKKNSFKAYGKFKKVALLHCPFASSTPLIKKKYVKQVEGFDENFPSCQDWDLWIRLSFLCECCYIPETLALHRIHGEQISTDILKKIAGREMILNKHYNELIKEPKILAWHCRRLGSLYALVNNKSKSKKYFHRALKNDKLNFGTYTHLFFQAVDSNLHKRLIKKYGIIKIDNIEIVS